MKPIGLLAAATVLGLAIGFMIGKNGSAPAESKPIAGKAASSTPSQRQRDRPVSAGDDVLAKLLGGRTLQSLSTGEIAKIIEDATKYDSSEDPVSAARRNYQLQLLLSKLPTDALAEISKATLLDPAKANRGYMVFGAWARRDWREALAWADSEPGASRWASSAITTLAATDPERAAELLNQRLLEGKEGVNGYSSAYGVGQAMAKLGGKAFLDFMDGLPSSQQSNVIYNSLRELPKEDLPSVVAVLFQRNRDGGIQDGTINSAVYEFMRSDPAKAKEWIDGLKPGDEQANLNLGVAGSFASSGKITESMEMLQRAIDQSPGKEKEYIKQLATQYASRSPEMLAALTKMMPQGEEMTAEDFKGRQNYFYWRNASELVDIARIITRPEEQAKHLTISLDSAAQKYAEGNDGSGPFNEVDYKILESRISSLALTGDAAASVTSSLQKLREAAMARPPGK